MRHIIRKRPWRMTYSMSAPVSPPPHFTFHSMMCGMWAMGMLQRRTDIRTACGTTAPMCSSHTAALAYLRTVQYIAGWIPFPSIISPPSVPYISDIPPFPRLASSPTPSRPIQPVPDVHFCPKTIPQSSHFPLTSHRSPVLLLVLLGLIRTTILLGSTVIARGGRSRNGYYTKICFKASWSKPFCLEDRTFKKISYIGISFFSFKEQAQRTGMVIVFSQSNQKGRKALS